MAIESFAGLEGWKMRIFADNLLRLVRRSGICLWFAAGLAALILVAGAVSAQSGDAASTGKSEKGEGPQSTPGTTQQLRRIEAVTWNPVTDELTWVVSAGVGSSGSYKAESSMTYLIHLGSATMVFNGQRRRFGADEADNVRILIDVLGRYAAESTIWWEAGMGQKVDDANPGPGQEGEKETKPQSKPKPSLTPPGIPLVLRTPESNSKRPL
jgi:hypothetical protein